jgi:NADPH-dependent curcumin reductase CurA
MTTVTARTVHLLRRPDGFPTSDLFAFRERELAPPGEGEALVENLYLSVDPYMRQLMDGGWPLDAPLGRGRALGRVVASRAAGLAEGDIVFHTGGWSTHALVEPGTARAVEPAPGVPLAAYLSVLGGTGLTAYAGMRSVLDVRPGESVYVSAAAGAVGGVAGQIARLLGAERVLGSAGSAAKVAHVTERLGFTAAYDYREGGLAGWLAEQAPEGLDATLDGVGGDHLEAAIGAAKEFGRIAWVGAISQYHSAANPPAAPRNLYAVSDRSLHLRGYQVRHHMHLREEAEEWLVPHLVEGRIALDHTVVDGFDSLIDAFLGVLRGDNLGKMLVRLDAAGNEA